LRQLQRELDALNAKIARDGQFASVADISKAKALTETIATVTKDLENRNHESAVEHISAQRKARKEALDEDLAQQERNAELLRQFDDNERARNAQNHLAASENVKARREAIIAANEADRKDIQRNFDEIAQKEKAADAEFDKRIADRIAKRKKEQETVAAGIENEARGISRLSRLADRAVRPLAAVGNFVVGIFRQIVRQIEFMVAAFVLLALSSPCWCSALSLKKVWPSIARWNRRGSDLPHWSRPRKFSLIRTNQTNRLRVSKHLPLRPR